MSANFEYTKKTLNNFNTNFLPRPMPVGNVSFSFPRKLSSMFYLHLTVLLIFNMHMYIVH